MNEPKTKEYIEMRDGTRFEVRDDIPPPASQQRVWPFAEMVPGQSIFFPGKNMRQVTSALRHYRFEKKWLFHTKTLTEDGVKGVRVWRIKGKHDYD